MSKDSSDIIDALGEYLQKPCPVMDLHYKYKVDDLVINKNTRAKGKITSRSVDMQSIPNYYVEYTDSWRGNLFEKESDLDLIVPVLVAGKSECECGSDTTYGKDSGVHANWCKLYVKGM